MHPSQCILRRSGPSRVVKINLFKKNKSLCGNNNNNNNNNNNVLVHSSSRDLYAVPPNINNNNCFFGSDYYYNQLLLFLWISKEISSPFSLANNMNNNNIHNTNKNMNNLFLYSSSSAAWRVFRRGVSSLNNFNINNTINNNNNYFYSLRFAAGIGRRPSLPEVRDALLALGLPNDFFTANFPMNNNNNKSGNKSAFVKEKKKELKKVYRELIKKNHPDVGGSEAKMAKITVSHDLLQSLTVREIEEFKVLNSVYRGGSGGGGGGANYYRGGGGNNNFRYAHQAYRPGAQNFAAGGPFGAYYYQQDNNFEEMKRQANQYYGKYANNNNNNSGNYYNPFAGQNPFSFATHMQYARNSSIASLVIQGLIAYLILSLIFLAAYRYVREYRNESGWRMSESLARAEQLEELHRMRQAMRDRLQSSADGIQNNNNNNVMRYRGGGDPYAPPTAYDNINHNNNNNNNNAGAGDVRESIYSATLNNIYSQNYRGGANNNDNMYSSNYANNNNNNALPFIPQRVGDTAESRAFEYARQRHIQLRQEREAYQQRNSQLIAAGASSMLDPAIQQHNYNNLNNNAVATPELKGWPRISAEEGRIVQKPNDPYGIAYYEPTKENEKNRQIQNSKRNKLMSLGDNNNNNNNNGEEIKKNSPSSAQDAEGVVGIQAALLQQQQQQLNNNNNNMEAIKINMKDLPPEKNVSGVMAFAVNNEEESKHAVRKLFGLLSQAQKKAEA